MSLETAKKYGFTASAINIIIPIVSVVVSIAFFAQVFMQILNGGGDPGNIWIGLFTGYSFAASALGIIGLILFVLSMYKLSKYYEEPKIFKNILYSILLSIICVITIVCIAIGLIVSTLPPHTIDSSTNIQAVFTSFISIFVAAIAIGLVISIINGVLYWQAFTKLGEKSGVDTFKTVGLLYLIGQLTALFGVGSVIIWIAWIYAAQAYKKIQPQPTPPTITYTTTPTTNSATINIIYCSYCGIENIPEAIYCKQCGKPLQTHQTDT